MFIIRYKIFISYLSYITFIIYIKHLAEAVGIYKANKDLKKAVKYLVAQRFISDTPHEIANFLRVYKNKFDAGEMLWWSCDNDDDDDDEYDDDDDDDA